MERMTVPDKRIDEHTTMRTVEAAKTLREAAEKALGEDARRQEKHT